MGEDVSFFAARDNFPSIILSSFNSRKVPATTYCLISIIGITWRSSEAVF